MAREGKPAQGGEARTTTRRRRTKTAPPPSEEVLGDIVDSGFEVEVQEDGNVRVHARCAPEDDPAACAEKVRFLVEALGAELVAPPDLPR
ncbi:hypothetical protein HY251_18510 [bacterium]|nr:hypothetical protein [bacterium]